MLNYINKKKFPNFFSFSLYLQTEGKTVFAPVWRRLCLSVHTLLARHTVCHGRHTPASPRSVPTLTVTHNNATRKLSA